MAGVLEEIVDRENVGAVTLKGFSSPSRCSTR
jgi:hypothetical protein